jgi:rod shape-determining protein MreB
LLGSPSFGRQADLGIDLGTSHTRLVAVGRGLVVEAPTVVASQSGPRGREVVAVGAEARKMLGKTPAGTEVVRPVRGGVVADFDATEKLLRALFAQAGSRTLLRPRVLVCVPTSHTEVERRAVADAARSAGARDVVLVASPMAAAIGADLPVMEPVGSLIVEVGGGRTEVAVVSLGGLVISRSIRVAGDAMDEAITAWLRKEHGLLVGERTAEAVKHRAGCALPVEPPLITRIRGRDLAQSLPREVDISSTDVATALAEPVARIRETVLAVLQETPPELAADILHRGVILAGGGGRLRRLDHVLAEAIGLPVLQADEPMRATAKGAMRILGDKALFERVTFSA